jgi:hypothetical protein
MVDWRHIRAHKTSNERPDDWPAVVRAISQEGLSLFGIKEGTGQLFGTASRSGRAAFFCSAGQSAGSLACGGRCFRHVPSQLVPFRAREVGLSKEVTRKACWARRASTPRCFRAARSAR